MADEPVTAYREPAPCAGAVGAEASHRGGRRRGELSADSRGRAGGEHRTAGTLPSPGRPRAAAGRGCQHVPGEGPAAKADPENNQSGEKLTVRELLDKAAKAVDQGAPP